MKRGLNIGKGHGGKTPNLPVIRQIENPANVASVLASIADSVKSYKMGKVRIIVSQEEKIGIVMSISHPQRYPTWDEVAKARYELLPHAVTFVMILPPPADYINIHENCFLIHELREKMT